MYIIMHLLYFYIAMYVCMRLCKLLNLPCRVLCMHIHMMKFVLKYYILTYITIGLATHYCESWYSYYYWSTYIQLHSYICAKNRNKRHTHTTHRKQKREHMILHARTYVVNYKLMLHWKHWRLMSGFTCTYIDKTWPGHKIICISCLPYCLSQVTIDKYVIWASKGINI